MSFNASGAPSIEDLKKLAEPFQCDDADVIIRAGGVDFPTHKFMLSHTSRVFKDMFSLPPAPSSKRKSLPVVEVAETPQTIRDILSLLYHHIDYPDLDDSVTIHGISLALHKYAMDGVKVRVVKHLTTSLQSKLTEQPVRVFAIACLWGLKDVAYAAAWETLTWGFTRVATSSAPEYSRLPATTFQKLLRYHAAHGLEAKKLIKHDHYKRLRFLIQLQQMRGNRNSSVDYIEDVAQNVMNRPRGNPFIDSGMLPKYREVDAERVHCKSTGGNLMKTGSQLEMDIDSHLQKHGPKLDLNDEDLGFD